MEREFSTNPLSLLVYSQFVFSLQYFVFPSSFLPSFLLPFPPSFPPISAPHMCCSIHIVKRPGAILHPGTLVATLELDDPSRIKQAKKATAKLPQKSGPTSRGDKINQVCLCIPPFYTFALKTVNISPKDKLRMSILSLLLLSTGTLIVPSSSALRCSSQLLSLCPTSWQGSEFKRSRSSLTD